MKFCTAIDFLVASIILAAPTSTTTAFAPKKHYCFSTNRGNHGCSPSSSSSSSSILKIVVGDTPVEFEARVDATFDKATPKDPGFEAIVQGHFKGAISNQDLVTSTARLLASKGYNGENTLLATSLCCDELARQLEDDFNGIYGNNFNLGGLAGFPFAGKTGFGAMAAHIPDDGYCLLVYGPHVGVSADGTVGKVERSGIALVDTCCGSAVAASAYVDEILSGTKTISTGIQVFTDFQQQGVQEMILPHGKRLADADNRMVELPYALFDSQDVLLEEIIMDLSTSIKRGLTVLGGVQINTGPDTPDYFVPLKFQSINYRGEVIDDLLDDLKSKTGGKTENESDGDNDEDDSDQNSKTFLSDKDKTDQGDGSSTLEEANDVGDDASDGGSDEDKAKFNTKSKQMQEPTTIRPQTDVILEEDVSDDPGDFDDDVSRSINDKPRNTKSDSIVGTTKIVAQSDIIIEKAAGNEDGNGSDAQRHKVPDVIKKRTKVVASSDAIIEKKDEVNVDGDGDSDGGIGNQSTTKPNSVEDGPEVVVPNDTIIEKQVDGGDDGHSGSDKQIKTEHNSVEDVAKVVAPNETILEKKGDVDVDDNDDDDSDSDSEKQSKTKPKSMNDVSNVVAQRDTIIEKANAGGDNIGSSSSTQRNTKSNASKVIAQGNAIIEKVNVDGNKSDSGQKRKTKPTATKITTQNDRIIEKGDSEEKDKKRSASIENVATSIVQSEKILEEEKTENDAKTESPTKGTARTVVRSGIENEKKRSTSTSTSTTSATSIEESSKSIAQNESILEEEHRGEDEKEKEENNRTEDLTQTVAQSSFQSKLEEEHRGENEKEENGNNRIEVPTETVVQSDAILDEEHDINSDEQDASHESSDSKAIEDVHQIDTISDSKEEDKKINATNLRDEPSVLEGAIGSKRSSRKSSKSESNSIDFGKNESSSDTSNQIKKIDAVKNEAQIESSSKLDGIVKGVQISLESDEEISDEASSNSNIISSSIEDGYFFTRKSEDKAKRDVNIDLLLDENYLSWLTAPESRAAMNGDTTAQSEVKKENMHDDRDAKVESYDEDSLYVGDTYLLGEQIASALETAEIDVVGVEDEKSLALALADALLNKIERDTYDRNNEGWNQFGAESLYSIGEDETDTLEDNFVESDDGSFTDEFLQHISIETAAAAEEDDSDSQHCEGEEIVLVADSILDIINRDEDEYDEETPVETTVVDTNNADTNADTGEEDDEPPVSHRYILKADGNLD